MALILLFLSVLLSFPILHVYIKICVRLFSKNVSARIVKFGVHMDNELLYFGIDKLDSLLLFFLIFVHFSVF